MENNNSREVVVIGGGIAGVSAALELAKHTSVILIEKNQLFSGSSGRNPGRMGHGFHYMDIDTAKMYLHASVAVQRNYPDFLIGKDLPFEHSLRHGRYYITKDSLYSFEQVMESYRAIQAEYALMVKEDAANEVFGPPEKFLKVLDVHEYEHYVNPETVVGAVETAEHLFNWPEFAKYIRQVLENHPNIQIYENTEVVRIQPRISKSVRFLIEAITNKSDLDTKVEVKFPTNFIVNSSWENIESLNETAGVTYINRMRTNRLKCLLEVKLPPSLINVNSSFFCMGAFCMFSNMGDGRGMMTLANVTNMATSFSKEIDLNMRRFVEGHVSLEEKEKIGREILQGVSYYIPDIVNAEFIDVKFGIVQTKGELNLSDLVDKNAAHHVRNYHGIREEYQGLISNPAMKLFYFIENAGVVRDFYLKQVEREAIHQTVFKLLSESKFWSIFFYKIFFHTIHFFVDRMMLNIPKDASNNVDSVQMLELAKKVVDCMTTLAQAKLELNKQIHLYNQIKTALNIMNKITTTLTDSFSPSDFEEDADDQDQFDSTTPLSHYLDSKKLQQPIIRSISFDWDKLPKQSDTGLFHKNHLPNRPKSTSACESGFEECKTAASCYYLTIDSELNDVFYRR